MQLNEKQIAGVFVIFIEPEAQEANTFVAGRVMEGLNKFSCGNFHPSTVNLRIVCTNIVLFVVTLPQPEAFTFLEKSCENIYNFCKDVQQHHWLKQPKFYPRKRCFEDKSTEFVSRERLRACR